MYIWWDPWYKLKRKGDHQKLGDVAMIFGEIHISLYQNNRGIKICVVLVQTFLEPFPLFMFQDIPMPPPGSQFGCPNMKKSMLTSLL
jgi:hypothetical protein